MLHARVLVQPAGAHTRTHTLIHSWGSPCAWKLTCTHPLSNPPSRAATTSLSVGEHRAGRLLTQPIQEQCPQQCSLVLGDLQFLTASTPQLRHTQTVPTNDAVMHDSAPCKAMQGGLDPIHTTRRTPPASAACMLPGQPLPVKRHAPHITSTHLPASA